MVCTLFVPRFIIFFFVSLSSGTAGSGATIRMYLERHVSTALPLASGAAGVSVHSRVGDVLGNLADAAVRLCCMLELTGIKEPTVIT